MHSCTPANLLLGIRSPAFEQNQGPILAVCIQSTRSQRQPSCLPPGSCYLCACLASCDWSVLAWQKVSLPHALGTSFLFDLAFTPKETVAKQSSGMSPQHELPKTM
ncbi:unnamed protein product [Symbiodinium microadriaticum]|nr:unnamed protein product [Symbiodinium microadriaticum]